jgi:hypothetical protein
MWEALAALDKMEQQVVLEEQVHQQLAAAMVRMARAAAVLGLMAPIIKAAMAATELNGERERLALAGAAEAPLSPAAVVATVASTAAAAAAPTPHRGAMGRRAS